MVQIYDIDILGELNSQGQIKELYNKEAIENSIKLWLTSFNTDSIRFPGRGGYLVYFLYKPMSDSSKEEIRDSIIDGLNQDYDLSVDLKSISVIPDYENKIWNIYVDAYIKEIQEFVSVSASVKNFV